MVTRIDMIRALFTYIIATCVVVGGGAALVFLGPDPASSDTRVVLGGFIGSALTFVFGSEVQTRTARQAATFVGNGTAKAADAGHV